MDLLVILFIVGLVGVAWFIEAVKDGNSNRHWSYYENYNGTDSEDMLSNGYSPGDYYDHGFIDVEVEFRGLDQPGAPEPPVAGWVIWDMVDGELDGEMDF